MPPCASDLSHMLLLSGIFLLGVGCVFALIFSQTNYRVQSKLGNVVGGFVRDAKQDDESVDDVAGATLYTRYFRSRQSLQYDIGQATDNELQIGSGSDLRTCDMATASLRRLQSNPHVTLRDISLRVCHNRIPQRQPSFCLPRSKQHGRPKQHPHAGASPSHLSAQIP
jgi:hypothetical protein